MEEKQLIEIPQVDITRQMEKAYIDYSMTVITSRALPDVRDGLKPVHRRILYAMNQLGLTSDKAHRKSATIVGEVMGNYHPHGDSAIYNSMVRLAQGFSMRYELIDGHGNFGSMDGDQPAAMRYTEARMSGLANELLRDINKETIDTYSNFDETKEQPVVLPSRFPNLLVNGSTGIAVGMTTSIPPHNMSEIIDACIMVIDEPESTLEDILEVIKGPDFPTGALIMGKESMRRAYRTGIGKVKIRSKAEIEEAKSGKFRIVVTEIPYMTNKARLLEGIADLVKAKKIDGITELRDESNRKGVRIVMELRRDANPNVILNQLFKLSGLQSTFSMIFIALDKGVPKTFNLKQLLEKYIEHQKDVETRRIQYDLRKAKERAHIVEGLLKAIDHIDEIIRIIRNSEDDAKENLMEAFGFTEIQANSILAMQLRRLQKLERQKLADEYEELMRSIAYFEEVLGDEKLLMGIIKDSLTKIKEKYGDERRTHISYDPDELEDEDLIEEKDMIIVLTQKGYIKRVAQEIYKSQLRGGRGVTGLTMRDGDSVFNIYSSSTHHDLLYMTNQGRLYRQKAFMVPEASRQSKGVPIVNLLNLDKEEWVTGIVPVDNFDDRSIIVGTKFGRVNRIALKDIDTNRKNGLNFMRLEEGDQIIDFKLTDNKEDIFIATREGKAIRFEPSELRTLGRNTMGVRGIKLREGDEVVSIGLLKEGSSILTITEKAYGKRTHESKYKAQSRNGYGLINYNITEKTGPVISAGAVEDQDEILLINSQGTVIRMAVDTISVIGRNTSGVRIMRLGEGESIIAATKAIEDVDTESEPEEE